VSTKYIEAAWGSYLTDVVADDASATQIAETRFAFFAGAKLAYDVMMTTLNAKDPGDKEMQRIVDIKDELDAFGEATLSAAIRGAILNG